MAEFKFGLEVVGLQPVQGALVELVGQQRIGGGARDPAGRSERPSSGREGTSSQPHWLASRKKISSGLM